MDSKGDYHPLDTIISVFANRWLIISITTCAFVLGIYLSLHNSNWQWLSRLGAIQVVCGLLLTMSPVFRRGIYKSQANSFGFAELDQDGNTQTTNDEDRDIGTSVAVGIIITIVGTLTNAFGDLVGSMLSQC